MWKLFDHEGTKEWTDVLDLLVENVNGSKNRSIRMAPEQALTNSHKVFATFKKGYKANFSKEVFVVREVDHGDPNMFKLKDEEGEPIFGKFYEQELSLVLE